MPGSKAIVVCFFYDIIAFYFFGLTTHEFELFFTLLFYVN